MTYKLVYYDTGQQVNNLLKKGFKIDDKNKEHLKILENISYFKLKPYIKAEENLNDEPCFDNVITLVLNDNEIRSNLIRIIEIVEIMIKAYLIDYLSKNQLNILDAMKLPDKSKRQIKLEKEKQEKGRISSTKYKELSALKNRNYQNINFYYKDKEKIEDEIFEAKKIIKKENIKFLEDKSSYRSSYFTNSELSEINKYIADGYTYENLPSWIYLEKFTFGTITIIYKYLDDNDSKNLRTIFKKIDYSPNDINNSLNGIRYLRNICSHNGRILNKGLRYSLPAYPKKYLKEFNKKGYNIEEYFFLRYLLAIKVFVEYLNNDLWLNFVDNLTDLISEENADLYELPSNYMDILLF